MQIITKKYFSDDYPKNAVNATATLTFSGVTNDGELVQIGSEIYEFDTGDGVAEGNILVDVSGVDGNTASASVTALVAAITNNSSLVTAEDGDGDTVVVTAKTPGLTGNSIEVSTDCANGSWGEGVTTLENGAKGTFAGEAGWMYIYNNELYFSIAPNDEEQGQNWRKVTLTTF